MQSLAHLKREAEGDLTQAQKIRQQGFRAPIDVAIGSWKRQGADFPLGCANTLILAP